MIVNKLVIANSDLERVQLHKGSSIEIILDDGSRYDLTEYKVKLTNTNTLCIRAVDRNGRSSILMIEPQSGNDIRLHHSHM